MPSTWSWVSKQSPNSFSSTSTALDVYKRQDQAGADKVVVENVTPALTADDIHVQVLDIKKSAEKLVDHASCSGIRAQR